MVTFPKEWRIDKVLSKEAVQSVRTVEVALLVVVETSDCAYIGNGVQNCTVDHGPAQ